MLDEINWRELDADTIGTFNNPMSPAFEIYRSDGVVDHATKRHVVDGTATRS